MQRILVLNPKGGSGKTTVAINIASHFALHGERPVLMDYDRQGSAGNWVKGSIEGVTEAAGSTTPCAVAGGSA